MIYSTVFCDRCLQDFRSTKRLAAPLGSFFEADLCDLCFREYKVLEDKIRREFATQFEKFMSEKAPKLDGVATMSPEQYIKEILPYLPPGYEEAY